MSGKSHHHHVMVASNICTLECSGSGGFNTWTEPFLLTYKTQNKSDFTWLVDIDGQSRNVLKVPGVSFVSISAIRKTILLHDIWANSFHIHFFILELNFHQKVNFNKCETGWKLKHRFLNSSFVCLYNCSHG